MAKPAQITSLCQDRKSVEILTCILDGKTTAAFPAPLSGM